MWPDYRNECHLNAHLYSLMCCAGQCVSKHVVCTCLYSICTVFADVVYMLPVQSDSCQHVFHCVFEQFLFEQLRVTAVLLNVVSVNYWVSGQRVRNQCVVCVLLRSDSMVGGVYILTKPSFVDEWAPFPGCHLHTSTPLVSPVLLL